MPRTPWFRQRTGGVDIPAAPVCTRVSRSSHARWHAACRDHGQVGAVASTMKIRRPAMAADETGRAAAYTNAPGPANWMETNP
ncbi:hypothetical protein C7S14_5123 [Burkholderia cepacia]|nr:hypothetical protein C7S14_5123 [Burkholderia cepacia]